MGGTNFFPHKHGCRTGDRNLKISAKKAVFLVVSGKNQISPLLAPLEKLMKKSTSAPLDKILPTLMHTSIKITRFLWKLCCIAPSGNTVQQHQCTKQAIVGWQTGHGVFCKTITKSCQIHVRQNIDNFMFIWTSTDICDMDISS